jgi:hypothetical protein
MKTYLVYVSKYSIFANDYRTHVYKVTTDCIYRIIGKIYYTSFERIQRISFNEYNEEREKFWKNGGYAIQTYIEPKLSEDN